MGKNILRKYGDRLLFALALSVLAVYLFRFLGNSNVPSEMETPAIVFVQWWEKDLEKGTLQELIEEFENLNEGIKIVLKTASYEDLRNALNQGEAALGDVLAIDPLWVRDFPERGTMWSVSPAIVSFIDVLYYNVELLKECGFIRPPKSRNEFINCARALKDMKENRNGFSNINALGLALGENNTRGIYDEIFPWIWAGGAQLLRNGNLALTSRQVVESLTFLASLNNEGFISPEVFSTDASKKLEDFVSGRIAFMIAPALCLGYIGQRMEAETYGVTSIPSPDNYAGKPVYGSYEWALGVYRDSPHIDEAGLFMDFLTEKASFLAERTMRENASTPLYSKVWDITIAGESAQDFADFPWSKPEKIFREELASLFAGNTNPSETAAAIQERWSRELSLH